MRFKGPIWGLNMSHLATLMRSNKTKHLNKLLYWVLISEAFPNKFSANRDQVVKDLLLPKMISLITKDIYLSKDKIVHRTYHLEDKMQLRIIQIIYKKRIIQKRFQK